MLAPRDGRQPWTVVHDPLPGALRDVVRLQHGLVTRRQLVAHGVGDSSIRHRTTTIWRFVLPGVIATFTGRLDSDQRLHAAQLMAGPSGQIAAATAARWHGLENAITNGLIRVQVPANLSARRAGFVHIARTHRPDDRPLARGYLRIAPVPRAVADAARDATDQRSADALVIEAVQRRLTNLTDLRHELEAGPRRGSRRLRDALAVTEQGVWSIAEADLVALVRTSSVLPTPWPNPRLRAPDGTVLPPPDLWFDDVGLAVQVHSWQYHARGAAWERTVRADSALAEFGVMRISVTPTECRADPRGVLARIERAYRTAALRPRPAVTMLPRGQPV